VALVFCAVRSDDAFHKIKPGMTLSEVQALVGAEAIRFDVLAIDNLRLLNLDGTEVTDAGLKEIAHLQLLEQVSLTSTQIRGPGLAHFKDFKRLRYLGLNGC
jgi:hypothetical protein